VSGCSHYSGQASTNSEAFQRNFEGWRLARPLVPPELWRCGFQCAGIGIGTAMSDSSDCGSLDSSNYRIIRKVGMVDSSSSFDLDTYKLRRQSNRGRQNTHAQMLLELRWADATKAQTDTQLCQRGIRNDRRVFPQQHGRVAGQRLPSGREREGFKYWYSYVSQAAKNEPGDNSTTYHIKVSAVPGLSAVRVTARIYYKYCRTRWAPCPMPADLQWWD